jgi:prepilin-type N-terminal cleavage/methylation domain-containing protein
MKRNIAISVREVARGRERAFTLVELLVVIVTFAILAALILPALARSDDNGARMVCMNNLRQMGMAANMYAGDNRDYLAFCNWDAGASFTDPSTGKYVVGWLYVCSGTIPDPTVTPYKNNPSMSWQTGLWFKYVQSTKYYLCPVDIESPYYQQRHNKLSSYVMNGAESGFATVYPPSKVTDAWSPGCWLLWEPDENAAGLGNPGASDFDDGARCPGASFGTSEGIGRLHTANGGEILCVGGNVQMVTVQTWKAQTTRTGPMGPGGKTLAWWSPFSINGGP